MSESNYELAIDHNLSSKSKASVASKISSLASSCRICLSTILDPASLSCGHKFCEQCLEKYWDIRDRPHFIVCPLCRGYAFDVNFSKKEPIPSMVDFRKTFNGLDDIAENLEVDNSTISCMKLSILVPALYYVLKWLKVPLIELFNFLQLKLKSL